MNRAPVVILDQVRVRACGNTRERVAAGRGRDGLGGGCGERESVVLACAAISSENDAGGASVARNWCGDCRG